MACAGVCCGAVWWAPCQPRQRRRGRSLPWGRRAMPTRKFFAVPMRQRKLVISLPGGDNTSNWKLVSADIRAYTSMGDRVADSYAALMPGHGFKRLIDVADQACKHGIGSVADA